MSTHTISSEALWPRDDDHRFGLYVLDEHGDPECLAASPTPAGIGLALCTIADENPPPRVMAILDRVERRWLTSLWPPASSTALTRRPPKGARA